MIVGVTHAGASDRARQLVDLAISGARPLQSSQTGFLHFNYRQVDYPTADTIPIYENFLFALVLLRDRTSTCFAEGKALLDKLLYFQNFHDELSIGNFPVYLHEYPICRDRYQSSQLLPVFYWTLRHFHLILGQELRDRLQTAASAALEHCLRISAEHPTPFHIAIKIAAAAQAFGVYWRQDHLIAEGDRRLEDLRQQSLAPAFGGWATPAAIADTLVALQMVYPSLAGSPWAHFWSYIGNTWHSTVFAYVGPSLLEYQNGIEPEATLYDLFLGFYAKSYSYRALLVRPQVLHGALIHTSDELLTQPPLPFQQQGQVGDRKWYLKQASNYGVTLFEKHKSEPSRDNGYSALKLLWGDINVTHSFVCQGGTSEHITYQPVDGGADLFFTLPQEVPSEVKQRNREVMFFIDQHEDLVIKVGGQERATAFALGEEVLIESLGMSISLKIILEQGQGQFFGHISLGNRPSQQRQEGTDRFSAFDWQIFLRTVHRSPDCKLRAEIRFQPGGQL